MLDVDPPTVVQKGRLQPGRMFLVDTAAGPHHRRRRDQGRARRRAPVRASGSTTGLVAPRRPARPRTTLVPQHGSVRAAASRCSATRTRSCKIIIAPMARDRRRAARLDGHRHADRRALATGRACCSTTSSSCSPRSPTRRSTPSARSWSPSLGVDHRARGQPARARPGSRAARSCCRSRSSTTTSWPSSSTSTTTATCPGFRPFAVDGLYPVADGGDGAARGARRRSAREVSEAIADGATHHRPLRPRRRRRAARRSRRCCSPSAVHHHLIREKTRTQVGLVVETGDAREVHHLALLLGYGAGGDQPVPRVRDDRRPDRARACSTGVDRAQGGQELHQGRAARACSR